MNIKREYYTMSRAFVVLEILTQLGSANRFRNGANASPLRLVHVLINVLARELGVVHQKIFAGCRTMFTVAGVPIPKHIGRHFNDELEACVEKIAGLPIHLKES